MNSEEFIEKLKKYYEVDPLPEGASKSPQIKGQSNLYIDSHWFQCKI
jgi:hypothetical protein